MSARPLVLVGGGEHAGVVADAALASGWRLRGYVDRKEDARVAKVFGLTWLGADAALADEHRDAAFVVAIGDQQARARVAAEIEERGAELATILHPRATIAATATVGPGTVVFANAVLNTGARVGRHVIVNTGTIVEHDVVLEDYVHVAPGVAIGGGARIGTGTFVGLGARVRDHITLGKHVTVGMGAAVVGDVADGLTVVGVPARIR